MISIVAVVMDRDICSLSKLQTGAVLLTLQVHLLILSRKRLSNDDIC